MKKEMNYAEDYLHILDKGFVKGSEKEVINIPENRYYSENTYYYDPLKIGRKDVVMRFDQDNKYQMFRYKIDPCALGFSPFYYLTNESGWEKIRRKGLEFDNYCHRLDSCCNTLDLMIKLSDKNYLQSIKDSIKENLYDCLGDYHSKIFGDALTKNSGKDNKADSCMWDVYNKAKDIAKTELLAQHTVRFVNEFPKKNYPFANYDEEFSVSAMNCLSKMPSGTILDTLKEAYDFECSICGGDGGWLYDDTMSSDKRADNFYCTLPILLDRMDRYKATALPDDNTEKRDEGNMK